MFVCYLLVCWLIGWLICWFVCLLVGWLVCWFVGLLVCLFFSGILSGNAWGYVEVLQINQRIFFWHVTRVPHSLHGLW